MSTSLGVNLVITTVAGRVRPGPAVVDLIVSASGVDEVQSSASEAGSGDIVGAVGLVATEVSVAVVIHAYQGTAAS